MPEGLAQEFVEYIVKSIVDHPDSVVVEHSIDELGTLISLHVAAEDMGTIIGKEGRTAKSLRTLLRVLGAKYDERVNLRIIEPEGGLRPQFAPRGAGEEAQADMQAPEDDSVANALKDLPDDII